MDELLAAKEVIDLASFAAHKGWVPATTGNFSVRTDDGFAITASGFDKGSLTAAMIYHHGVLSTDLNQGIKPSAEMPIHEALYHWKSEIKAVAHTHSLASTVLTRVLKTQTITFSDYEIGKAFPDISTHETLLTMPLFDNHQDMNYFADQMINHLSTHRYTIPAIAIRGHGITVWGNSTLHTKRYLEALEFILAAELTLRGIEA